MSSDEALEQTEELTEELKEKIETNRQRALAKRKAAKTAQLIQGTVRIQSKQPGSSRQGDGFFEPSEPVPLKKLREAPEDPVPCIECMKPFLESLAREKFYFDLCDDCRKSNDKYRLVPRTEAKTMFKLKDCDIDKRPPVLRFIEKPNPHREHGARMKLYLFCQLEEKAKQVWGSLTELDAVKEKRKDDAQKRRKAGFNKKISDMRRELRTQAYQLPTGHEHSYGPEQANPDVEDEYFKLCSSCGYRLSYEKL